ncbi:MAG: ABC transporter ATP-binding protein [Chitinispirillaceae bacterium]|nr:ABC transporter ATP-binding protein [Chitinispirillaceae bacterium]
MTDSIVSVTDLRVHFPVRQGVFGHVITHVKAVDGVSFSIDRGSIFAIVGESGCGKTTSAQAIAGLQPATSGSIRLLFRESKPFQWAESEANARKSVRQRMQMIFQDPYSSLNPRMTVRTLLEEPFIIHRIGNRTDRVDRIATLLDQVGLSREYLNRYPHEFSGGQRQRIGIARALATDPELIIADEPVSALDVSIQAQIINLLQDLRASRSLTQLFISHDLAVVRHLADRIAVMYRGKIVEYGSENDLFTSPRHPYTVLLLESVPIPGKGRKKRGATVSEDAERQQAVPGCSFYPRCPRRRDVCIQQEPELTEVKPGHGWACFNPVE